MVTRRVSLSDSPLRFSFKCSVTDSFLCRSGALQFFAGRKWAVFQSHLISQFEHQPSWSKKRRRLLTKAQCPVRFGIGSSCAEPTNDVMDGKLHPFGITFQTIQPENLTEPRKIYVQVCREWIEPLLSQSPTYTFAEKSTDTFRLAVLFLHEITVC